MIWSILKAELGVTHKVFILNTVEENPKSSKYTHMKIICINQYLGGIIDR